MAKKRKKYLDLLDGLNSQENLTVVAVDDKPVKQTPAEGKFVAPVQALNARTTTYGKADRSISATNKTTVKEEDDKKWYQEFFKGSDAFDDGYDFGDVTKTILGSGIDVVNNAAKGILGVVEGVTDLAQFGVGATLDLFGADKAAEKVKESAKKSWVNAIMDEPMDFYDQYSIFGDTTDAVFSGVGQGLTYMASGGLGAVGKLGKAANISIKLGKIALNMPTLAIVSGAGSGLSEAYNSDENIADWQAWTKGIGSGMIEGFAEGLFGMFGVGGSSLDDAATHAAMSAMKSGFAKAAAKVGVKAAGEGVEEQISYALNYVLDHGIDAVSKLTGDEARLGKEWSNAEFWENFFVGTLSAVALQGGGTAINITQAQNNAIKEAEKQLGRNLTAEEKSSVKQQISMQLMQAEENDITVDEQKVLNSVIENRVDGQTLTNAELKKIRQQALNDLKRGYVSTEDIENTLLANDNAEIAALKERLAQETDKKSQMELQSLIAMNEINKQTNIEKLIENNQLFKESYLEQGRKSQAFTYEETDNEYKKAVYEDASKIMNNTNRAHDFVETVAKIAEDRGTKYRLVNNAQIKELGYGKDGKTVNGLVTKDGEVLINVDSKKALNAVLGHETTHLLEGTQEAADLKEFAKAYAESIGDYTDRVNKVNSLYANVKGVNIENEITADIVGEYLFTDEQFINELSAKKPNIFQKIYNYVKHLYKMATAGSAEARQLEQLKYKFEKAYKNTSKQANTGTKYSLGEDLAEAEIVKKEIDIWLDNNTRNEEITESDIDQAEEDIFFTAKEAGLYAGQVNEDGIALEELLDNDSDEFDNDLYADVRAEIRDKIVSGLLANGFENSYDRNGNGIYNKLGDAQRGYDELIEYLDENDINYEISRSTNAGDLPSIYIKNSDGETIFRIANHYNGSRDTAHYQVHNQIYSNKDYANWEETIVRDMERALEVYEDDDTKYSLTDNQGRELTKEQQEHFKDSKARDENGNLLTMYHGTEANAGIPKEHWFNTFDIDKSGRNGNMLGEGFYFTTDESHAKQYAHTKGNVYETYLDIRNPLELDYLNSGDLAYNIRKINPYIEADIYKRNGEIDGYKVRKYLLDNGYDGIHAGNTWVVFNSNQIKNVDNTKPTDNPDIRYSLSEAESKYEKAKQRQDNAYKKLAADFGMGTAFWRANLGEFDLEHAIRTLKSEDSVKNKFIKDNNIVIEDVYKPVEYKSIGAKDTNVQQFIKDNDITMDKLARNPDLLNEYFGELSKAVQKQHNVDSTEANEILKKWRELFDKVVHDSKYYTSSVEDNLPFGLFRFVKDFENIKAGTTQEIDELETRKLERQLLDENPEFDKFVRKYAEPLFDDKTNYSEEEIMEMAIENHGTTNDFSVGAYMTTDGQLLDFGYGGYRDDHRTIDTFGLTMTEFMEAGAIRMQPETPGFELVQEPSKAQYERLHDYIDFAKGKKGTIFVDIAKKGNSNQYDSAEYNSNTPTNKIISDLQYYFKNGQFPKQSDLAQFRYSLSRDGEQIAPIGAYNVYGKDVKLEVEETIAPLQETITELTEQVKTLQEQLAPINQPTQPTQAEIDNLIDIRDNKSGSEYASAFYALEKKYGKAKLYQALNNHYNGLPVETAQTEQSLDIPLNVMEMEHTPDSYTDEDMPISQNSYENVAEVSQNSYEKVESPFDNRDIDEVGKRNIKAYMYENPEVKPFFQEEAKYMLTDLKNSIKGERIYIPAIAELEGIADQHGGFGWTGTKRQTTDDIAYLIDKYGYSYAQIEEGLNKIIEDDGKENNAVSKRIEFMLDERLKDGYTDVSGVPIPPNQDYRNLLEEKAITEYYSNRFKDMSDEELLQMIQEANTDTLAEQTTPDIPMVQKAPKTAPQGQIKPSVKEQYKAPEPKASQNENHIKTDAEQQAEQHKQIAQVLVEEPATENNRNKRQAAILAANVLDKGLVFENLSLKSGNRELQGKWDYTLTSEARAQNVIGNGHTKGGAKLTKSLNEIRAEVDNSGLTQDFYNYMYHKLNVDRMTLEERYALKNKPVFGDSVTAEQSQELVNQYENAHPEFMDWAQDVYDYVNADRQQLVNNGVISQETADYWSKMYPHYVPIRRADKNGNAINVPLDTGRTGINAPVKKATGGSANILPLFDTMALRTLQTYRATAKNSFGIELMNTIDSVNVRETTSMDEVIDSVDAQEELLQEGKNGKKPTFTVFDNGEKITFEITENMYDALKPLSDSSLLSKTNKVLNTATNIRRGLLTEYNPVFMLTNGIKDVQDILLNSQHAAKTYAKIPEAYAQMVRKGYWYQEYMENGGQQNSYFDSQDNNFKEEKGITTFLPLKAISRVNNFIELAPRLAEYIASREAGASIETAMLDAARVTTNFKAGGNLTKFLNRNGATFLNASVQGAMQQVRNVREANANGIKGWANLLTKYAIAGLPALMLNGLMWDDDEEYEELSDYVKQNYYIVAKNEDGTFVRIPKGRAVAVIQEALTQMGNLVTGDDEADLKSFLDLVVNNLAPNNPLKENIFAPITQAATNTAWYGGDLVPKRLQDLPAEEQYDESTDAFSKWLGGLINVSPYKINYVLDQYSGGIGDVILPMLTPEAENGKDGLLNELIAPLNDKFTTNSTLNNQNVTDFYDLSDELTTGAKKSNATDEDVLMNKYINSVKAEMSELYIKKREIQNSDLRDSEKYQQVLEVQRQINELAKEALSGYKNVTVEENYSKVEDREYRINNGEWTKLTDKQLEKQNEVTKALGITPNEYWSGRKEEYDYAYENPAKYTLATTIADYETYKGYTSDLYDLKADKDEDGKSISGSRKEKVIEYVNNLDIDYGQRLLLFKSEYNADDTYNQDIIDYLNEREDVSYEQMKTILIELGFEVDSQGNVYW